MKFHVIALLFASGHEFQTVRNLGAKIWPILTYVARLRCSPGYATPCRVKLTSGEHHEIVHLFAVCRSYRVWR
jgi:hypothetical protein